MSQFLLMYFTGKRLALFIGISVLLFVIVFSAVVVTSPSPTDEDNLLATRCLDGNNSSKWLYPRGNGSCDIIDSFNTNEVVFAFQLPKYSRWQQYLLGVLQLKKPTMLTIDARLAYRNKEDPDDAWKLYASSVEERILDSNIPLFALSSVHHDYYLLNVRLPKHEVQHLRLLAQSQNSDFTKIWFSVKTTFVSFIINIMVSFWKRKRLVPRSLTLLEYAIFVLGAALVVFNVPLEYLTLMLPIPFMSLLDDIRLFILHVALLWFWIVFSGELVKDNSSDLRCYWKHLTAIVIGCLSVFIFDVSEHGILVYNPFGSIETSLTFNILAAMSASTYFFYLCYMTWKVFPNLNIKQLPTMTVPHLLLYKRFFIRLKILALLTLICAALTVTEFIVARVSQKNGDLRHNSIFFVAVYLIWNIYTFVVTIFCIPICLNVTNSA